MSADLIKPVSWRGRRRRLILGFGALIVLALLFAGIVRNAVNAGHQRREAHAWYVHTLKVLVTAEGLRSSLNMAIRGERGYLITHDDDFLRPYDKARGETPGLVLQLSDYTRDNPRQQRALAALRPHVDQYYAKLAEAIALRRAGREADAVTLVRTRAGMREIDALLALIDGIESEERRLLAVRSEWVEQADRLTDQQYYALAGVGAAFLLIAAAAGISTAGAQKRVRQVAEELRMSASTDELTGLANRRVFMQMLEIEVARAERGGRPLSVAMVDIDYFKRVNDRYGHAGGDQVLRIVAKVAEDTMRFGDVVARVGGEEFAVLMPDTGEAAARIACERLRAAVASRLVRLDSGEMTSVTVSTGVALLVAGEDGGHFVTRADDALYRAKEGGRNQVRLAA